MTTVIKAGPALVSGSPEMGARSLYTPPTCGYFQLYRSEERVESPECPFFAFANLASALHWWREQQASFLGFIFLWEAESTRTQPPPPFVVKTREWPLWEAFWSVWKSGQVMYMENWGGEQGSDQGSDQAFAARHRPLR